jgi:hypothetical protein
MWVKTYVFYELKFGQLKKQNKICNFTKKQIVKNYDFLTKREQPKRKNDCCLFSIIMMVIVFFIYLFQVEIKNRVYQVVTLNLITPEQGNL